MFEPQTDQILALGFLGPSLVGTRAQRPSGVGLALGSALWDPEGFGPDVLGQNARWAPGGGSVALTQSRPTLGILATRRSGVDYP